MLSVLREYNDYDYVRVKVLYVIINSVRIGSRIVFASMIDVDEGKFFFSNREPTVEFTQSQTN